MTSPTIPARPTAGSVTLTVRILLAETLDELRGVIREPTALFFSVAMPVGFYALFVSLWGAEPAQTGGMTVGSSMLATFGTFGVVGVTLLTPGVGVAEERERGWLRAKRVSPTPLPVTLAAKVIACVPHALAVLLAMTAIGLAPGTVDLAAAAWARLATVLVIGALPFALIGLAVGFLASTNATTAILMALYIPSSVASGLWMPLEVLPETMQRLAPALPTYHLARLGLAQVDAEGGASHLAALVAMTVVAAGLASLAYRRSRP